MAKKTTPTSTKPKQEVLTKKTIDATVAIPILNGQEFLDDLLKALFSQKTDKTYEVLAIDSGSTDKTLEIIAKYPKVRLHQIPNSEFGHGKTRNLAVRLAYGRYVVFLTQDAVPSHDRWLDSMLEPFTVSPKVSCVFGRQIPRPDCFATLKREVASVFNGFGDEASIIIQRKSQLTQDRNITNNFFSDVNSAVDTEIMQKIPFRDVPYAEDQALGIDMLDAGYLKGYAPLGSVWHSHDYPLRKYFRRKFDESVGLRKSTGHVMRASIKELTLGTLRATLHDYVFIARDRDYSVLRKLHDYALSPCYNFANRLAIRIAASQRLSDKAEAKFSLEAKARKQSKS